MKESNRENDTLLSAIFTFYVLALHLLVSNNTFVIIVLHYVWSTLYTSV